MAFYFAVGIRRSHSQLLHFSQGLSGFMLCGVYRVFLFAVANPA